MKRLFILLCALAAVTVALATPVSVAAAPPGCTCGGYQYTPQDWAQASSCAQATSNLSAQANAYIECDSGLLCGRSLVLTAGCHWDTYTGMWQVDGYVKYRCWLCE
jgi:hypothetical protein